MAKRLGQATCRETFRWGASSGCSASAFVDFEPDLGEYVLESSVATRRKE